MMNSLKSRATGLRPIWKRKEVEMEDRVYYRELECYEKAEEALRGKIGRNGYFDLSLLPTETMKEEFRRYIWYRGQQITLSTIRSDNIHFRQFC